MPLIKNEQQLELFPASPSGKTSRASYRQKTTLLAHSLASLPGAISSWSQGQDQHKGSNQKYGDGAKQHGSTSFAGQSLVVCLDPSEQSRGGSLMPNISEWPNDAAVCSLSQVLEKGSIPQRFFLSAKACAGILRRAEKRGKTLPPLLEQALRSVLTGMETTTPTQL